MSDTSLPAGALPAALLGTQGTPPILYGFDVSNNNGVVDWRAAAGGNTFGGVKVSEGVGYTDPFFAANLAGLRATPLLALWYHFARPDLGNTPQAEAAWFLARLPALQVGDMVALDIEVAPGVDHAAWALAWLQQVARAVGFPPLLYTYLDYAERWLADPALAAYPLWVAAYQPSIPPQIGAWQQGAAIWQRTSQGTIPGVSGPVDISQIARDLQGLKALGKPPPVPQKHVIKQEASLKPTPDHLSPALTSLATGTEIDLVNVTGWTFVKTPEGKSGWVLSDNIIPA